MTHRTPDGAAKRMNIELTAEAHAALVAMSERYGRSLKSTVSSICLWVGSLPPRYQMVAMMGMPLKEVALVVAEMVPELLDREARASETAAAAPPPASALRAPRSPGARKR